MQEEVSRSIDSRVSDVSREGPFYTGMMKIRAEVYLGGKIESSDLDVSKLRCLLGTEAVQYVDLKAKVRDLKVTGNHETLI